MKNIILLLFTFFTLQSCQYFEKKVPEKKILLDNELKKIDWTTVDEPPSVSICDSLPDKQTKEICFFNFIHQAIQSRLAPDSIRSQYPEIDTLFLKITLSADAVLTFETQSNENHMLIDSLLQTHLSNFPAVDPAIKKGMKVKSQFLLPVKFPRS
jgi:hypothetical protein